MPHIRRAAAVVAAVLALPATASAHVTLQPSTAPADGFTRLDVRVPNERDDASTVKVDVQLPPGFAFVSYEPRPGWKVDVKRVKLDEPIEVEGGFEVDEGVGQITWSGGRIGPGEFVDFGLSLRMPKGEAGDKLTFKALQTYDDGDVVRWIGPEDGDEPAPTVTLTDAASRRRPRRAGQRGGDTPVSSGDDGAAGAQEPATGAETAAATVEDDGGGDGLAIAALAVAVLALIAGLAAFDRPPEGDPMIARATAVAVTVLALVAAAPAAAHVGVKSYSPKRGATVARSLERVKVTFKGRITDGNSPSATRTATRSRSGRARSSAASARCAPASRTASRRAPTRPR